MLHFSNRMIPMQQTNFPTYVFATVNPGMSKKVVEELKNINAVEFVAPLAGRFDLAIRFKQTAPEQVYQFIQQIRSIQGITGTFTAPAFNGFQATNFQSQFPLGITLFNVTSPVETFLAQLKTVPGLVEAYTVPGQFDILALWQAKSTDEIVKASVERLPTLQGISKSETLLAQAPLFKA